MNNSVKNSNHTFLNLAVSHSFVTKTKYVTFLSISDAMFLNVLDQIHKSTTYLCFKYSFAWDYNMPFSTHPLVFVVVY
jgi:hypothetical protein